MSWSHQDGGRHDAGSAGRSPLDFVDQLYGWAHALSGYGLPAWAENYAGNAFLSILTQLLPAVILFLALGYGLDRMALKPRYWKLTFILLGITALLGLTARSNVPLYSQPLHRTLTILAISLFIYGLPEELFMRGFLLPRFERVLGSPINALVATSVLFNALHIPSDLAHANPSFALWGCPEHILSVRTSLGLSLSTHAQHHSGDARPHGLWHCWFLLLQSMNLNDFNPRTSADAPGTHPGSAQLPMGRQGSGLQTGVSSSRPGLGSPRPGEARPDRW